MRKTKAFVNRIMKVYNELVEYRNKLEQKKDSRATFTYAYSIMTLTIAEKFEEAQFKNKEWVTRLTEHFADHYITALKAYDNDYTAPGGWQIAFDTICKSKSSVLEELVISMYVHIVQDLPLSLIKVGMEDQQRESGISDYHKMNELLNLSINDIQTKVAKRYNPLLRWIDSVVGNKDEILTNYGIRLGRGMSWYNARRMTDPDTKESTQKSLEKSAVTFINSIRHSKFWIIRISINMIRSAIHLFRKWETS